MVVCGSFCVTGTFLCLHITVEFNKCFEQHEKRPFFISIALGLQLFDRYLYLVLCSLCVCLHDLGELTSLVLSSIIFVRQPLSLRYNVGTIVCFFYL